MGRGGAWPFVPELLVFANESLSMRKAVKEVLSRRNGCEGSFRVDNLDSIFHQIVTTVMKDFNVL